MAHTTFDRHANMDGDTVGDILTLINDVQSYSRTNDLEFKESHYVVNSLYGMFDGFLYHDILDSAKNLSAELRSRIEKFYKMCDSFPKLENASTGL